MSEKSQTWLYHPIHGGHLFDDDALPRMELGWVDTPAKYPEEKDIKKEWRVELAVAIKPAPYAGPERVAEPGLPGPAEFASFDDYMDAFVATLNPGLAPAEKGAQKKRAIEHYAAVKHAIELKGGRLEEMAEIVRDAESK